MNAAKTGLASLVQRPWEGACFVGIERDASYAAMARARIKHWASFAKRRGDNGGKSRV